MGYAIGQLGENSDIIRTKLEVMEESGGIVDVQSTIPPLSLPIPQPAYPLHQDLTKSYLKILPM